MSQPVQEMREAFEARRSIIVEGLNAIEGISCGMPEGAFYAFPQLPRQKNGEHVDSGEFVGIMGESGAGKSTLLSILGAMNTPSTGTLTVDDIDVYDLKSEQRADFRRRPCGAPGRTLLQAG